MTELDKEQARRVLTELAISSNEKVAKSADAAVRNCLLINGGAAVAILAFMGAVISKDAPNHKLVADIAGGLTYFAWGVISDVAALGLIYLVHFFATLYTASLLKEPSYSAPGKRTTNLKRANIVTHALAVVLTGGSAVLFVLGLFAVKHAVTTFP